MSIKITASTNVLGCVAAPKMIQYICSKLFDLFGDRSAPAFFLSLGRIFLVLIPHFLTNAVLLGIRYIHKFYSFIKILFNNSFYFV